MQKNFCFGLNNLYLTKLISLRSFVPLTACSATRSHYNVSINNIKLGIQTVCLIPVSDMTYTVLSGTLNSTIPYHTSFLAFVNYTIFYDQTVAIG